MAVSRWNLFFTKNIRAKSSLTTSTRLASSQTNPPRQSSRFIPRFVTRTAVQLIALGLGFHVFFGYFYTCEPVYGISMLPTIPSFGDWVVVSKYYRRGRGVQVGDVVSFWHPVREGEKAIKRVVGLEGDFVLMNTPGKSEAMIQIPQGHCWVTGDNLAHSRDSRMFGPLPVALLQGKVIAKFRSWLVNPSWIEHGLQDACIDLDVD